MGCYVQIAAEGSNFCICEPMSQVAEVEVVDDASQFFAPVSSDLIDGLIGQYQAMRAKVERVAAIMNGPDLAGAIHYFAEDASRNDRHLSARAIEALFNLPGAIANLNASYWAKAMNLTDVLDVMPQARRSAWNEQITNPLGVKNKGGDGWKIEPIPEFNDDNVRSTLTSLLTQREKFFAERVDGIFQSLSRTHVTNAPEGFGRRMIISRATNEWGSPDYGTCGVINDLRCVIAKFMGRDDPSHGATDGVVRYARRHPGQWFPVDGGALRIRCYMVGTAHLEVHPDMAWRLNCVLAQLHPAAIPSKFREQPKKRSKEFKMMSRPLPFPVLSKLSTLEEARDLNRNRNWNDNTYTKVPGCYDLKYSTHQDANVLAEAENVLSALGGVKVDTLRWKFDYNPLSVVEEIVISGCLPDQKSHQYYPTPEALAKRVVELAEIGPDHECLEPSAGTGGLADLLPRERTTCLEISGLHCKVLEAKGHNVIEADFLTSDARPDYDRIVMNPPFSEGRWSAHLTHAASLLAPGGRLVAVLPSSAMKGHDLDGFDCKWHGPLSNQFPGVSIDVAILVADRL